MSDAASLKQGLGQNLRQYYEHSKTGSLCNRRFDLRCEIFQFQLPTQQMVRRSATVKSKIDHPIERGRRPTELGDFLEAEGAKVFAQLGRKGAWSDWSWKWCGGGVGTRWTRGGHRPIAADAIVIGTVPLVPSCTVCSYGVQR